MGIRKLGRQYADKIQCRVKGLAKLYIPSIKFKEMKLLINFIKYADKNNSINSKNKDFFRDINLIFENGNDLDQLLYELDKKGIIVYDEVGEDGFAPICIAAINNNTLSYLNELVNLIEIDYKNLEFLIKDLFTFEPEKLSLDINSAQKKLIEAKSLAKSNTLLSPILNSIEEIEKHFASVVVVSNNYADIYKNIIRPVQIASEDGVKSTVKWAIISVIISSIFSLILSNWSSIDKKLFPSEGLEQERTISIEQKNSDRKRPSNQPSKLKVSPSRN